MDKSLCIFWLNICLFCGSKGVLGDLDFYTAGVVEFRPTVKGMSSADLVADHLKSYLEILESAEANDTDIIVFPEGTLNNDLQLTYVPDSKDKLVLCLLNETNIYADFLIELSCAARRTHKYLVINLSEKENCPSEEFDPRTCASNGLNTYNTNVVFDREGRIVSRYRKVHVYVENKNTTYKPEYAIFDTDFGVRFGHFICFDMLFYTPVQELVKRFGITHFILTSYFFSELPFLTGVQLQQSWAWGNNVTLLAAGASFPQTGTTGSGIYVGEQGDLISIMVKGEGERKLYKARVPKNASKAVRTQIVRSQLNIDRSDIILLKDPQIENFTSVLLDLSEPIKYDIQLCQGNLCCHFDITTEIIDGVSTSNEYYKYRVGVFEGRRTYEKEEWSNIKVCALYACANGSVSSCGELPLAEDIDPRLMFRNITISGNFIKSDQLLLMPSTIDDQLYPLKNDVVFWNKLEMREYYKVFFTLTQTQSNILTFGIYGNYYDKSSGISNVLINNCEFPMILFIILKLFQAQFNL